MFERFTEDAREVVAVAQGEARTMKHDHVGPEHLLLGLLSVERGLAAETLASRGITTATVHDHVQRAMDTGDSETPGRLPLTPRAKKVLELALREALALGNNYIGTEHVLLALVRERDYPAAQILRDLGADPDTVEDEVRELALAAGVRSRRMPRARAPRYEYRIEVMPSDEVTHVRLNELGNDGWLLAGSVPDPVGVRLVFARPKRRRTPAPPSDD